MRVIISDLGGVFLNRGIWNFWRYIESEFGIDFEYVKSSFLKNYKSYFTGEILEEDFWGKYLKDLKLDEDWNSLRDVLLNFFEINEEVANLYLKLKNEGYKLVLLSDQTIEWWNYLNGKLEIDSFFDYMVISAEVGYHKPQIEIYKFVLEKVRIESSECVFIDDLKDNLLPAENLGIRTIFFRGDSKDLEDELKKLGFIF